MFCGKCGERNPEGFAYCGKCGAMLNTASEPKFKSSVQQNSSLSTVATTGESVKANPYPDLKTGKSKALAIVLAIFLGFWSWIYTYKRSAWKFWLGFFLLIVEIVSFYLRLTMMASAMLGDGINSSGLTVTWFLSIGIFIVVWLWAIIDNIGHNKKWFEEY